ncbi:hypothetical protein ACS0TY_020317 [Phlomoides rotata]
MLATGQVWLHIEMSISATLIPWPFIKSLQGSEIQCSACKSPASGNAYACWQCTYFLHEHCFRATRSLKHPSHPLHPLTLAPSPTYPSGSFICNSCSLGGDGLSYSCSECEFDIHVHCALIPNPIPHNYKSQPQIPIYPPHNATPSNDTQHYPTQTSVNPSVPNNHFPSVNPVYPQPNITALPQPQPVQSKDTSMTNHFSHPHFLKPNEIEQKQEKICSACDSDLSGSAYSCTKPHCSFKLHKACFDSPREVRHKLHPHPLTLLAAPATSYGDGYICDACQKGGKAFVYNCATCSYDLHMDCFRLPKTVSCPDHDHPLSLSTPVSESFMCDENVSDKEEEEEAAETEQENVSEEEEEDDDNDETGDMAARLFKVQQQHAHSDNER